MDYLNRPFNKQLAVVRENSVVQDVRSLLSVTSIRFFLLISFALRLIFQVFLHSSSPSNLAPDEGTYAYLSEYVAKSLAVQDFQGYGPYLYNQSKSLILPSSVLIRIGLDPLDSVRLVSSIYGFFIPILTLLCFMTLRYTNGFSKKAKEELASLPASFLIAVLFFLPSNFLWSTLGLRESASQFWILTQTYLLSRLVLNEKIKKKTIFVLFIVATAFSFASRPQSALLYCVLVLFVTLIIAARRCAIAPTIAVIFSIMVGYTYSSTPTVYESVKWELVQNNESDDAEIREELKKEQANDKVPNLVQEQIKGLARECRTEGQVIEVEQNSFSCLSKKTYQRKTLVPVVTLPLSNVDSSLFEERRNANRVGASSALAPSNCLQASTGFNSFVCNLREIPYRLFSFLFRPLPLLDDGSTLSIAAGIENVIWLLLFLIAFAFLFRLDFFSKLIAPILSISFFIIFFSTAAALYEGNMGTAFRHKSTILGHLILLLLLLLVTQKREIRRQRN